jgi:hypothetical protein
MRPLIVAALTEIGNLLLKKFGMVTAMGDVTIQAFLFNRRMLP